MIIMVEETVEQLKRLHAIEDVEHAIFALERGMPVPPKIVDTMKMMFRAMVMEYNSEYAERQEEQPASKPQPEPGTD